MKQPLKNGRHYVDEQKKQKQLLWEHYEARAGDNGDKAVTFQII